MAFAYQQVKVIWSVLLRHYEFDLVDRGQSPNYATFVVGPRQPCRVRYRSRPSTRQAIHSAAAGWAKAGNPSVLWLIPALVLRYHSAQGWLMGWPDASVGSPPGRLDVVRPRSFSDARNQREKARSAGLHPDNWYAVEHDARVPAGHVVEVKFWGRSIAVFRGTDGTLRALENRCAHRHVKLSLGQVTGCTLTCAYHGWSYDSNGRLVDVPHELFGREFGRIKIVSYPVRSRYGLIWLFPGNAALAERTPMPEIPELGDPRAGPACPSTSPGLRITPLSSTTSVISRMPICVAATARSSMPS